MRLTDADVEHVAALARLGLSADEKERMRDQLSTILGHINALAELDTAAIPPTAQVISLSNVWRDDDVRPSLPQAAVLANAPRTADGFFEVHTPLGGPDEGGSCVTSLTDLTAAAARDAARPPRGQCDRT